MSNIADAMLFVPRRGEAVASRLACLLVQPLLARIIGSIAGRHPSLLARLGPHQATSFLIDPIELPFMFYLRPDPQALVLRAFPRDRAPRAGAVIRGRFMLLLEMIDSEVDGDAAFFSRDLEVSGETEAVVQLRNALDDIDGSIAEEIAEMFGVPGRAVLTQLRKAYPSEVKGHTAS
ncbi:ubiquinone anaerobic biosynthesis accessory factor UbiT [Nisaea denitrificans]|uniref:ubiquinone anaerobic biosynthesis accessory factor UbiT n=1 Tax=Nisaea denitrificans TaxID=390877 RepID=UPI00041AD4C4|nr:SCP2 sterol-binding domain-containing protein [Nisaea denitrificans]